MIEYKQIPPSPNWHKNVLKLANEYNKLVRKGKNDKIEKILVKIEDGIIKEEDAKIKRDYAFLVQLIENRHEEEIFHPEILKLHDYMLGGKTGGSDEQLVFQQLGEESPPSPPAEQQQPHEQFNIETIVIEDVDIIWIYTMVCRQIIFIHFFSNTVYAPILAVNINVARSISLIIKICIL